MNEILKRVNIAFGVNKKVDAIDASRNIDANAWQFAHDRAYRHVAQEKWSENIFYLACLTLVPVIPVVMLNHDIGIKLLGGTLVVEAISLVRRKSAIDAVQRETLAHQK